eukprot:TRINITY_DN438_c0_g1_i1.p1 TRINITY_DN438_c0_g1~~TRINITY_DN438_c0_g1_i1.p1  ORF type:complete len:157 (-),score=18.91 TRINITY_DN438_c0_g1_i1:29-499(-)
MEVLVEIVSNTARVNHLAHFSKFNITILPSDDLQSIKQQIREKGNILEQNQRLVVNETYIEEGQLPHDWSPGIICHLVRSRDMVFIVRTLEGGIIFASAGVSDTIQQVKETIGEITGYNPDQFNLVAAGKSLNDLCKSTGDYNMCHLHPLHLIWKK